MGEIEIQRYKDTEIQRYRDTEFHRHRDTEIQRDRAYNKNPEANCLVDQLVIKKTKLFF